ncbi:protein of unknown function [Paraburkholderia kururiensis]
MYGNASRGAMRFFNAKGHSLHFERGWTEGFVISSKPCRDMRSSIGIPTILKELNPAYRFSFTPIKLFSLYKEVICHQRQ